MPRDKQTDVPTDPRSGFFDGLHDQQIDGTAVKDLLENHEISHCGVQHSVSRISLVWSNERPMEGSPRECCPSGKFGEETGGNT
jgi:hypothetical protein